MTTTSERVAALQAKIAASDTKVTWRTPEDLSRRSVEAMVGTAGGHRLPSHGTLHLTGEGVTGSSAPLDDIGQVMTGFQRLVTAWGAALEGAKNIGGRLSDAITAKTRLRLVAGIAPGSVVLNITPDLSAGEELMPDGMEALIEQPTSQHLDQVMEQVASLVAGAEKIGPDPSDSPLVRTLQDLGPRAASSVRSLAEQLSTGRFNLDLEWSEPNKPTYRGSITSADAGSVARIIASRELDSGHIVIVGQLRTSSDEATPLCIEVHGQKYKVRRGQVTPKMIRAAHAAIGDTVRVEAQVILKEGLGGDKVEYRATKFEKVDVNESHRITGLPEHQVA